MYAVEPSTQLPSVDLEMEAKNLGYSVKNIPLSNKAAYQKALIGQTESFLRRLRWKVFHFLSNSEENGDGKANFGFPTSSAPPKNQILYNFENDMYEMIRTVEFEPVRTSFQRQLSEDLKSIKNSDKVYVPADKTRNMYGITPQEYDKLLKENVTKTYKKTNAGLVNQVNSEASKITEKLKIEDRVQCIAKNEAFITIKDHKPNFPNAVACRLLNPCKSEVGKISKSYLEKINNEIRRNTGVNQWRSNQAVLDWFNAIPNKKESRFIKFDIVSFYPTISRNVLLEALDFAKTFYDGLEDDMVEAILNSRKSFLYFEGNPWIKKDTTEHFDVTEGSFDGAEVCELVGLHLLSKLRDLVTDGSVGLYRDDGLAVVHKYSGPQMDRLRKKIIDVFKQHGFQITISIGLKSTDFLDILLDLENNRHYPYKKPNDTPVYVHRRSNHPVNILKQVPKMTSRRLSKLSSNQEEFEKVASEYQEILTKSDYTEKLSYSPPSMQQRRRRNRKVLYYNPPFDLQVKTNIGKTFLQLLDKNFPPHHRLNKIINRNTVKLSYSTMPNMASHIASHNKKILQKSRDLEVQDGRSCNCENPENCPLNGNCLQEAVVYQADVTPETEEEQSYLGLTEPPFKGRWNDHCTSFRHQKYKSKSKLSSYIWKLQEKQENYQIKWSIIRKSTPYRTGSKKCDLCLWEKYYILNSDKERFLNKRDEILNKCRHRDKFLLKNFKD